MMYNLLGPMEETSYAGGVEARRPLIATSTYRDTLASQRLRIATIVSKVLDSTNHQSTSYSQLHEMRL